MTDAPAPSDFRPAHLLPLAVLVVGIGMVLALAWAQSTLSIGGYTYYLALGGPIAVGAAAILGHRSRLTLKRLVFLVVVCSLIGGFANAGAQSMSQAQGPRVAPAIGMIAGTPVAVLAAYFAGVLVRRGARARQTETIADTFG